MDPITNEQQWFFDRVPVVESGYVDDGNGMVIKADPAVLPDEQRRADAAGVRRGLAIVSNHDQGVVVRDMAANETTDQSETALELNVAMLHCDGCVGWV